MLERADRFSLCFVYCAVKLLLCFLFWCIPCVNAASLAEIVLDSDKHNVDLRNHVLMLKDEGYTIEQVASSEFAGRFSPAEESFYPGKSSSGYWLRFTVRLKESGLEDRWIFEVVPPQIKKIVLFTRSQTTEGWNAWHAGYGNSQRTGWRNELFLAHRIKLSLVPETFYVFAQADDSFFSPLLLVPDGLFFYERSIENIWIAVACGFAFALIVYNLFLLGTLKDFSYLWYSLQGMSLVFYFLLVRGVVFQYVTIDSVYIAQSTFAFLGLFLFFSALFVKSFFANAVRSRVVKSLLNFLPAVPAVLVLTILFLPVGLTTTVISILNIAYPAIYLFLGVWFWRSGFSAARFFLLAWVFFIFAAVLTGVGGLGILRSMDQMLTMLQVANLLEMLLLSFALADRIAVIRRERFAAREVDAAKRRFLPFISHEIFDPLGKIANISTQVLESNLNSKQRNATSVINRSAEHLKLVVSDIVDVGAIEAGEFELNVSCFNLRIFLSTAVDVVKGAAEIKGLELSIHERTALPEFVYGDPLRLRQILLNLLANAVKFTAQGKITLEVEMMEEEALKFSIIDTGAGIPPAKLKSIFESFTQADNSLSRQYGGTGLGLAISKKLVEMMGGFIEVQSVIGKGSCFSIVLPLDFKSLPDKSAEHDMNRKSVVDKM